MVHAGTGIQGVKGRLSLVGQAVVFRPEATGAATTTFDLANVSRARRVLGSPVLELQLRAPHGPAVVGFYFVEPPSLEQHDTRSRFGRRTGRSRNALQLVRASGVKKAEIITWVGAIRRAS